MPNTSDYVSKTGLTYFWNRIKTLFPSKTAFDTLSDRVDDIISEGGEPNVINAVKVNGTALVPDANKAVDVTVPTEGSAQNTSGYVTYSQHQTDLSGKADSADIPTKVSDLTNDGDGTAGSAFATEDYVDQNGGKIDKIKRNGTELQIDSSDKSVNILVPDSVATTSEAGLMSAADKTKLDGVAAGAEANVQADWNEADTTSDAYIANKPTIPANVSDLTNDANYQTDTEVEAAIDAKISSIYKPKGSVAFANLPALAAANEGNVYNITDNFTTTADFVEGAGSTYPAGTNVVIVNNGTDESPSYKYDVLAGVVDLSGYWSKAELTPMTTQDIDDIMTEGSGS